MNSTLQFFAAVLCLLGVLMAQPTVAEEQTITISVMGQAQAMPDIVQLTGTISENSEKMKDAVTAFRDTHRRTLAAIKALEIKNLETKTSDLSISLAGDQQIANQFGIPQVGEPQKPGSLTISQQVKLTVSGLAELEQPAVIDLVVELMDGAKEAGIESSGAMDQQAVMMMRFGMGGMAGGGGAVFKLKDPEALRKAAMKDAVSKARKDAATLAELAGAKLGGVVAISDGSGAAATGAPAMQMWYGIQATEQDPFTSATFAPIKVGQPLTVTFKLITE